MPLFRGGGGGAAPLSFTPVRLTANKMEVSFATQLFIDGQFVDAKEGKKLKLYNPHDESLICEVSLQWVI